MTVSAPGARNLRRGETDAAAGAVDEQRFAGLNARAIVQRAPGGDVRHADAGALRKGQSVRQRVHLMRFAHDLLRVGAVARLVRRGAADEHARAHREAVTPAPTASTTPAASAPGVYGSGGFVA